MDRMHAIWAMDIDELRRKSRAMKMRSATRDVRRCVKACIIQKRICLSASAMPAFYTRSALEERHSTSDEEAKAADGREALWVRAGLPRGR